MVQETQKAILFITDADNIKRSSENLSFTDDLVIWCDRRDLNPYPHRTRPSNVRVCQFRHDRALRFHNDRYYIRFVLALSRCNSTFFCFGGLEVLEVFNHPASFRFLLHLFIAGTKILPPSPCLFIGSCYNRLKNICPRGADLPSPKRRAAARHGSPAIRA